MQYDEFAAKYHISLNPQQMEAVQAVDGSVLVLAVPGSGKTFTLVVRLGYMICCRGIRPEEILVLTYTVAAAREMRERFRALFGDELADRLEFRTINGVCSRIIFWKYGNRVYELESSEAQRMHLLSELYRKVEGSFATASEVQGVSLKITYIKNMLLSGSAIDGLAKEEEYDLKAIYRGYLAAMKQRQRMDYDDQLLYAFRTLRDDKETLKHFQKRYPYICVDEAQDTSRVQHAIIALLAKDTENLFMVGDEDQSIYGFRAAYPQALLSFTDDHPQGRVLVMEENYRSNANIVQAADAFIRRNVYRHPKTMRAHRPAGARVRQIELQGRGAQYSYLLKVAADCQEETAVLYRDHESVLPLIDKLVRNGIPFRMRSAEVGFFTSRIVLDICNIIRLAYNPGDAYLFLQLYYKLGTYLRKADAEQFARSAQKNHTDVLDTAIASKALPVSTLASCKTIRTHLHNLQNDNAVEAIKRITGSMGYGDYIKRMELSDSKLFTLRKLAEGNDSPLILLTRLNQLRELISHYENPANCSFILSTIHSSKGLEYDVVYLIDVMDGIFPEKVIHNYRLADEADIRVYEEERRLFYVGMTRAKEKLNLFSFKGRSAFVSEVMKYTKASEKPDAKGQKQVASAQHTPLRTKEGYRAFCEELGEGVIVRHRKFGRGVVVKMDEQKLQISFDSGEEKMLFTEIAFQAGALMIE